MDFMEIDIILGGYTSPKAANPSLLFLYIHTPPSDNPDCLNEKLSSSNLASLQHLALSLIQSIIIFQENINCCLSDEDEKDELCWTEFSINIKHCYDKNKYVFLFILKC
jgi:hypothetical protein